MVEKQTYRSAEGSREPRTKSKYLQSILIYDKGVKNMQCGQAVQEMVL